MNATHPMNTDIFSGQFRQYLGQARLHLGRLLGSERQIVQGRNDLHIGQLQQAYGTARHDAQQLARRLKQNPS